MTLRKLFLLLWWMPVQLWAQAPFSVEVVPLQVNGSPGLHSFAAATHNDKWLFLCGRINGLHGFVPPPGPFPTSGANPNIWVVDPTGNQTWSAPITSLPAGVQEQLLSNNPQFWQDGNTLYIIGGFGHIGSGGMGFTTLNYLTAVDVSGLMDAVMNGTSLTPYFRQISDNRLKVTGGELGKIGNTFYLAFGHDWEGGYNRDNPAVGTQIYTHEVRAFEILDNGTTLSLANYVAWRDTVNYRRRDLTVVPSVKVDGSPILEAFGGVFRADADLPHLKPITIDASGPQMSATFEQMTNHYTAAHLSLFDSLTGDRHNLIFGGIGMYYFDPVQQTLILDSLVPFVDNITLLTKNAADVWQESILNTRMPGLLGANAFILQPDGLPEIGEHVIRLDKLSGRTLVGYFFGGIAATQPNNGPSSANNQVFEIYLTPGSVSASHPAEVASPIRFEGFPNPTDGFMQFSCTIPTAGPLSLTVFDLSGRAIQEIANGEYAPGTHVFKGQLRDLPTGIYIARLSCGGHSRFLRIKYISE